MVKTRRHENDGHEGRRFYAHRYLETGSTSLHGGLRGAVPDSQETEGVRRKLSERLYCGFYRKEPMR